MYWALCVEPSLHPRGRVRSLKMQIVNRSWLGEVHGSDEGGKTSVVRAHKSPSESCSSSSLERRRGGRARGHGGSRNKSADNTTSDKAASSASGPHSHGHGHAPEDDKNSEANTSPVQDQTSLPSQPPNNSMSFLGFGGARPQPSSAEKIAAAEAEIEMVSNMFNQYAPIHSLHCLQHFSLTLRAQTSRHLLSQMHPKHLPRIRPQQGRVCMPRPLRIQVFRCERQGQREDAGRGIGQAGRWDGWRWGYVRIVRSAWL